MNHIVKAFRREYVEIEVVAQRPDGRVQGGITIEIERREKRAGINISGTGTLAIVGVQSLIKALQFAQSIAYEMEAAS